jgi:hypothetical protein
MGNIPGFAQPEGDREIGTKGRIRCHRAAVRIDTAGHVDRDAKCIGLVGHDDRGVGRIP